MSIKWTGVSVCGIPVVADPFQGENNLEARSGDILVINIEVDDQGRLIGATGHIARPGDGEVYGEDDVA